MENGAISFSVFGYPQVGSVNITQVKEEKATTGALKRMATKKQATYVDDDSEPMAASVEPTPAPQVPERRQSVNRMERKATLTEKKGMNLKSKEVIGADGTITTVGVVGKEESACCIMF